MHGGGLALAFGGRNPGRAQNVHPLAHCAGLTKIISQGASRRRGAPCLSKKALISRRRGEQPPRRCRPGRFLLKIFRIFGRKNCEETLFALEMRFSRRKKRPAPPRARRRMRLKSREGSSPFELSEGFFSRLKSPVFPAALPRHFWKNAQWHNPLFLTSPARAQNVKITDLVKCTLKTTNIHGFMNIQ